jgi:FKBP-type peptidyl-prolyl cis-trans isomerase FkpA
MYKLKFPFLALLLVSVLASSCGKEDLTPTEQLAEDIKKIEEYLADNNLVAQSTASGLHYIIETEGSGGHPSLSDEVSVIYKGYYLDGKVFDQVSGSPITFPLDGVIAGWQEGIPLFKKGGKGKLFLPSALAYGEFPPPGIRKNAVLAFDVELVDF